jgi:tetratricopeptide (TPR) repeat protein
VAHHGASLENIVDEVGAELGRVLRICGALCVLGLLESEDLMDSQANLAQPIRSSYVRSESMSEAQLLGVRPDAGRKEIEKSYLLKRLEWTHIRKAVREVPSLDQMASEILFRLAAAYNNLVSANKLTPPGERYPNELPEAELSQLSPIDARPLVDGSELELSRWKNHRSDELIRDVKLHVQARDWGRAVPLLFVLVEREPTNAHYRGLLAKAMFRHPTMRKNAGRHFQEAIRLAPNNSDYHLWLGLYCKAFGLGSRAVTEFRTALELDPNNQMAKKHLMKDTDPAGYIPNPFRKMSIH